MIKKIKNIPFENAVYKVKGEGNAIIFVHGFAEDSFIWEKVIPYFENEYKCIIPDIPGSGMSPLNDEDISIEDMAKFLHFICIEENIEKVIIYGHSMGGYIALAFAELFPSKLSGIGLIHSTAYADDDDKIKNREKSIQLIQKGGKEIFLKSMIPNLYSSFSNENLKDEIKQHLTIAMNIPSNVLVTYYKAMTKRSNRIRILSISHCPVLFVIGKNDNVLPYQNILEQASIPKASEVYLLDNIGHTSPIEAYKKLNSILKDYSDTIYNEKFRIFTK